MYNLGIVGRGFVGSAVEFGFSPQTGCDVNNMYIYDKDKSKSLHPLENVVLYSDIIFLSVPTPSNSDGSINLSYVEDALQEISEITSDVAQSMVLLDNIILIRSTVTPGTTRKLQQKYQNLNLVFNPEFLTESNHKLDFVNQDRFILGGDLDNTEKVADLFEYRFPRVPLLQTDYETAELTKYMNNCFLATKVSFLNEMKQISEKCGADWDVAIKGFLMDSRIGQSHYQVPGPDGKLGFGGHCLPKDINALKSFGESLGLNLNTLNGVINTNLEVRPEKDWESDSRAFTSNQIEIPFESEEWEKEYIPELGNRYTLKDVEMIQEGVRQHQSDKE